MNKSLLKILVATVAVSATVATTVFAVRKLKKNKTKDKETVNETVEEAEESEVETAEKEAEETVNETVTDDEENKEEEKNNTKEEKEVRKDKKKKDKKNKKKNKKNKNKKMTKEETNKSEEVKEAEAETAKEEVTEETMEEVEELNDEDVKPDSEDSEDPINEDTEDECLKIKIRKCMEEPLNSHEDIQNTLYYTDEMDKAHKELLEKDKDDECEKRYKEYSKNRYIYFTNNHLKKLPEFTYTFIKSLTKEERKYEDLIIDYLSNFQNFENNISDESDMYPRTFERFSNGIRRKIFDRIDKSNSKDATAMKKIIDNYNIYLLSELRKLERTFDVANMINGLN